MEKNIVVGKDAKKKDILDLLKQFVPFFATKVTVIVFTSFRRASDIEREWELVIDGNPIPVTCKYAYAKAAEEKINTADVSVYLPKVMFVIPKDHPAVDFMHKKGDISLFGSKLVDADGNTRVKMNLDSQSGYILFEETIVSFKDLRFSVINE